jgi:uridine kinase
MIERAALIEELASRIVELKRPHPVRVAIDGVDGAGKTTLADELAGPMGSRGRQVIRASVDGFHNPRKVRYCLGRHSPEGFYRDSFNYGALTASLLLPLSPRGSRRFRRAVFDHLTDSEVVAPEETAADDAILIFDGIFAHRPELTGYWDLTIFLEARFEVSVRRSALRSGGPREVDAEENRRYVEGQQLYLRECDPKSLATVVVDNNDLDDPRIIDGDTE